MIGDLILGGTVRKAEIIQITENEIYSMSPRDQEAVEVIARRIEQGHFPGVQMMKHEDFSYLAFTIRIRPVIPTITRVERVAPSPFPAPDPTDLMDSLRYSRFLFGYAVRTPPRSAFVAIPPAI